MKNLNKSRILLKVACFCLIISLVIGCESKSTKLEKEEDVVILRHLKYYGQLFEEYHQKTGKYPYQEMFPMPLYIYIANDKQMQFVDKYPESPCAEGPFSAFVRQIESALDRPVSEYYDPKNKPVSKPNYYYYRIHDDTFYFTVYVHHPYSFARRIGENYYKVIVSNKPDPKNQIHDPSVLLNSPDFNAVIDKTLSRQDFFEKREDKYKNYTKSKRFKEITVPRREIL